MTPLGNQQYFATLRGWKKKVGGNLEALARGCAFEMAERVVRATPVDTGFLRGSWQPSLNNPIGQQAPTTDPMGAKAMTEIGLTINGLQLGETFYMINNAAYARRLEYGFVGLDSLGRYYNQKGRFYITDTIKRWKSVVTKVANELAK